ncbi:hypothetical protein ROHU_001960 [Xyrichtys novacula]|uniref:Uncharacterized protein n=1 Tax=Xyrichtys novacula TaxID=13765 RepID=A0AAV1FFS6_XYRNO|nr:hypothetical protein ROHU_001960 [Xyrichtys novacula]
MDGLLDTSYDMDRVVVELKDVGGLKLYLPLLTLPPPSPQTLRPHFHLLKKHVSLAGKGTHWVTALQQAHGVCMGMLSGGYYLNLTLMPKEESSSHHLFDTQVARVYALRSIQQAREAFVARFTSLAGPDLIKETVKKNLLSNPSKLQILEPDQRFFLGLLGKAVSGVQLDDSCRWIWTVSRFGQKRHDYDPLCLDSIADSRAVEAVSIHMACTLVPKPWARLQVLWSASGMEFDNIASENTQAIIDAALPFNYNIELFLRSEEELYMPVHAAFHPDPTSLHRSWDIDGVVVELYLDTPHTHLPKVFVHPVSGCVAICGLFHAKLNKAMYGRGLEYIQHFADNLFKFGSTLPSGLWVEQVRRLQGPLPTYFKPSANFNEERLWEELENKPLLLPYAHVQGKGLMTVVHGVMGHLLQTLREVYANSKGAGGFQAAWTAFQAELGLEEMVYGRPLSRPSDQLSQILGTSSSWPKSLSHMRGFLGLEAWNVATAKVCPPPLENWTKDASTCSQIRRIFGLVEVLKAPPSVIGAELFKIALSNLFRKPPEDPPLAELQAQEKPDWYILAGAIAVDNLVGALSEAKGFVFPMALGRTTELVCSNGLDVAEDTGVWLTVLTFLLAVGLLENNKFVDCKQLNQLIKDIPLPVSRLQELLLLSKHLLLKGSTPYVLWKLHETIPVRVPPKQQGAAPAAPDPKRRRVEQEAGLSEGEGVGEVPDDPVQEQDLEPARPRYMPASTYVRWSAQELCFISLDRELSHGKAYKGYLKDCLAHMVPARQFSAFKRRRISLLSDVK